MMTMMMTKHCLVTKHADVEVSGQTVKTAALVPTAFLVLRNFHSCFYNSIETRYLFSFSVLRLFTQIFPKVNDKDKALYVPRRKGTENEVVLPRKKRCRFQTSGVSLQTSVHEIQLVHFNILAPK